LKSSDAERRGVLQCKSTSIALAILFADLPSLDVEIRSDKTVLKKRKDI